MGKVVEFPDLAGRVWRAVGRTVADLLDKEGVPLDVRAAIQTAMEAHYKRLSVEFSSTADFSALPEECHAAATAAIGAVVAEVGDWARGVIGQAMLIILRLETDLHVARRGDASAD
jgi:hypothetical protein